MKTVFLALTVIAATGCASITEGTTQNIRIKTDVPCTASRGEMVAQVGPESQLMTVKKSSEPINLDCGGQIRMIESKATKAALTGAMLLDFGIIDMITGAFWAYPDEVDTAVEM